LKRKKKYQSASCRLKRKKMIHSKFSKWCKSGHYMCLCRTLFTCKLPSSFESKIILTLSTKEPFTYTLKNSTNSLQTTCPSGCEYFSEHVLTWLLFHLLSNFGQLLNRYLLVNELQ
jgi:hypothetical protein